MPARLDLPTYLNDPTVVDLLLNDSFPEGLDGSAPVVLMARLTAGATSDAAVVMLRRLTSRGEKSIILFGASDEVAHVFEVAAKEADASDFLRIASSVDDDVNQLIYG